METRPTLITFVLALLALTAALLVSRSGGEGSETRHGPQPLLQEGSALPVDQVNRIELQRDGEPRYVFIRTADRQWQQVEPFPHPMQAYSIRQLAVAAAELTSLRRTPMPESGNQAGDDVLSLAALGLDPPRATIRFHFTTDDDNDATSRQPLTLHLGRRGPAGQAYLLRDGGDTIDVVRQDLHARAISDDIREWRDRRLFAGVSIDAQSIERTQGDEHMLLTRSGRRWSMEQPVQTRVDNVAIEEFAEAIGKARAADFVQDQPQDLVGFGLDQPAATLSVQMRKAELDEQREVVHRTIEHQLLVGAPAGASGEERFAMIDGQPVVVRISAATVKALFRPAQTLADPTGSGVNPADVKRIRIAGDNSDITIERELDTWQLVDQPAVNVDPEQVRQLLQALTTVRAGGIEFGDFPLDLQVAAVTLIGYDLRPLDTVRIGREPQTGRWAFENGDRVLRVFPSSLNLPLEPESLGIPASDH